MAGEDERGARTYSVTLNADKCIGCTACLKRCPTEAIRVRDGKAVINGQKCIDCGLCIRVCEQRAKNAVTSGIHVKDGYGFKIAVPAPSLYAQFKDITDINIILTAVKDLGFDEVIEASAGAELAIKAEKAYINSDNCKMPVISSSCPAIVRLVCMRFPSLVDNLLPLLAPAEIAARAAKGMYEKKGYKAEDIGVFFISPCAAKNTYSNYPLGIDKSAIDGVISIQDVYLDILGGIKKLEQAPEKVLPLVHSGRLGACWARSGGEIGGLCTDESIAVDGVENVIQVLDEVENGQLTDIKYIECLACAGGCVGGPLTITNAFVAKSRLNRIESAMHEHAVRGEEFIKEFNEAAAEELLLDKKQKPADDMEGWHVGNRRATLEMIEKAQKLAAGLPGIDCGSCGSPTCEALAEDIVAGLAEEDDCVFRLKEKFNDMCSHI